MDTTSLNRSTRSTIVKLASDILFVVALLLIWFTAPKIMHFEDNTIGYIDPSIWLLVLLAIICFLIILPLSWWLLQRIWRVLNLPSLELMVSQFKFLEVWQQLGFYFACFALLLLAGVGCLVAVL
jgi:hypothetical protein